MPTDPSLVPALAIPEVVEQAGAIAGFASFIGLAVLSALYFSQARDVKRLREWAGRAPEREPAERAAVQARAQAAALAAQQRQQAQRQQQAQQAGPAQPAGPRPASAAGSATATAPGAPRRIPATPSGNGAPAGAPPLSGRPASIGQSTQILPPGALREPWYRRLVPDLRTALMALGAVVILGAAVAFAVIQVGGDDAPESSAPAQQQARGGDEGASAPPAEPPSPSEITVSVLNGTTVTGLASQYRDALEEAGYDVGNAANFVDQAKAESVVLYAEGERPAARVVAKDLDINQIERVDPESQRLGGNASVIVVLGADKTP